MDLDSFEQAAERRAAELDTLGLLFDISRALAQPVDLTIALAAVLDLLEARAGLSRGMVTFLDKSEGVLRIAEARGPVVETLRTGRYRLGKGLVGRVFESGETLTETKLASEPWAHGRGGGRSPRELTGLIAYCAPIRQSDAVLGTLSAERRSDSVFRNWDAPGILERAAALIADSAKLRDHIQEDITRTRADDARSDVATCAEAEPSAAAMVGTSDAIRAVYTLIDQVAPSDATVLITGESGTGKELVAGEIHRKSRRSEGPFVKVNCAALPESIIESELFGHEKGSFTGAAGLRRGRFELAHGGTIFLDEIGELSPQVQVKLLRVLQEREIERLGGSSVVKVDVRVIAATNRRLEEELASGRFREDLYYRLNVFPIRVPPLRERKSDIVLLADHFTEKYARKNGKAVKRISSPAIDLLTSYHWPGNVRELENCVERAVILSTDMVIHSYHLPPSLQSAVSTRTEPTTTLDAALSRLEKELIVEALKIAGGNMASAARRLGITERQMGLRVRHYAINWRLYRTSKLK